MTKKQMIQEIQTLEAAMWLELKKSESVYGVDAQWVQELRSRWSVMNTLMDKLSIPQDFLLPDNQEATAIICERIGRQVVHV